jgi:hypothetical protein
MMAYGILITGIKQDQDCSYRNGDYCIRFGRARQPKPKLPTRLFLLTCLKRLFTASIPAGLALVFVLMMGKEKLEIQTHEGRAKAVS